MFSMFSMLFVFPMAVPHPPGNATLPLAELQEAQRLESGRDGKSNGKAMGKALKL